MIDRHPKTPPLPDPTVTVDEARSRDMNAPQGSVDVVIDRGGKCKSFRGEGSTTTEIVKDVVEKILKEPYTGEFIKK